MPGSTPVYGITYPCGYDTIDPAVLATFATTMDTALATSRDEVAQLTARPNAQIRSFTSFNLAVNTDVTVTFDSEIYDNDAMANLGVSNDRLTVNTEGLYFVNAQILCSSGFTTVTSVVSVILVNGVERCRLKSRGRGNTSPVDVNLTMPVDLFVGDFVQLRTRWTGTGGPAAFLTRTLSASYAAAH